jgi:glycerol uptake facilitator protein
MQQSSYRLFMAEMLGTMFILLFGNGVNAMVSLFNLGGYTNITFGWGFGGLLGVLVSSRISGAHLNPAITIALAITRRFPTCQIPLYVTAQMVGGLLGAAVVYGFYAAKFPQVDPTLSHSAAIFTTFPAITTSFYPGLLAEVIATAILLFAILALSEHFERINASALIPFAVAALIVGIGMSFGGMHGYAMNPARDLSPRLLVTLLGFKHTGLGAGSWVWAAPVMGSLIGAPLGAWLYDLTLAKKDN